MTGELRQRVVVQPGGIIVIQSPELIPGAPAEVVVVQGTPPSVSLPLARLIGAAKGSFTTPAEVDAFINQERDAWVLGVVDSGDS